MVTLIVAMDETGLIGRGDELPWRLPEDLKQFRGPDDGARDRDGPGDVAVAAHLRPRASPTSTGGSTSS